MRNGVTATGRGQNSADGVDLHHLGRNHHYMSTGQDEGADDTGTGARTRSGTTNEATSGNGVGEQIRGWFVGRLPGEWFTGPAEVVVDREEITVVGTLPEPETSAEGAAHATEAERAASAEGRIRRFREDTRSRRIEIAREAEHRFRRKVAWGARCAERSEMFTTLSVPVMTRLRQPERRVLDTLVDAGVARSRSDALAWCVRLTGEHADSWLTELRDALRRVEEVRSQGPAF
jgi:hypothetical protein